MNKHSKLGDIMSGCEVSIKDMNRTVHLVCMAGGGMSKSYFELGGNGARHDFASAMRARGAAVDLIDQPGVGAVNEDGLDGGSDPRTAAKIHAMRARALRRPGDYLIGVGHSMGGMSIILAQDASADFDAIVLMGSNADGVEAALLDHERAYIGRQDAIRADLSGLVEKRTAAIPASTTERAAAMRAAQMNHIQFAGEDEAADAMLKAARAPTYWPGAITCMIPGGFDREAAAITVPILMIHGEHDLGVAPELAREKFSAAPRYDILRLPATGHNHLASAHVTRIADHILSWAEGGMRNGR